MSFYAITLDRGDSPLRVCVYGDGALEMQLAVDTHASCAGTSCWTVISNAGKGESEHEPQRRRSRALVDAPVGSEAFG